MYNKYYKTPFNQGVIKNGYIEEACTYNLKEIRNSFVYSLYFSEHISLEDVTYLLRHTSNKFYQVNIVTPLDIRIYKKLGKLKELFKVVYCLGDMLDKLYPNISKKHLLVVSACYGLSSEKQIDCVVSKMLGEERLKSLYPNSKVYLGEEINVFRV